MAALYKSGCPKQYRHLLLGQYRRIRRLGVSACLVEAVAVLTEVLSFGLGGLALGRVGRLSASARLDEAVALCCPLA